MQIVVVIFTGLFVLAAQYFLSRFSQQRERDTNRLRYRETQLKNVYGPILSICLEMLVLSDQRERARDAVQQKLDQFRKDTGSEPLQQMFDEQTRVHEYYYQVDRDNVQKYSEILKVCKDNYYLLESTTKETLVHVMKHVEAYNLSNEAHVPIGLVGKDWFPSELNDFFVDVRNIHEKIRTYVVSGDPITIGDLTPSEPTLFAVESAKKLLTDKSNRAEPGGEQAK